MKRNVAVDLVVIMKQIYIERYAADFVVIVLECDFVAEIRAEKWDI